MTAGPVLAFDTSSRLCVCGVVSGRRTLSSRLADTPAAPSEGLLPMIHDCLAGAGVTLGDLLCVVVGRGPGSFTGTRIALATAKGLALGSGVPLVGVSSVRAAALDTGWGGGPVVVALDARKQEILLSAYGPGHGGLRVLVEPALVPPPAVAPILEDLARSGRVRVVGDAPASHPAAFPATADTAAPDAPLIADPASLVTVAGPRIAGLRWDDPDVLEPVYSRPPPVHGT